MLVGQGFVEAVVKILVVGENDMPTNIEQLIFTRYQLALV